jgi:hypothetical protein
MNGNNGTLAIGRVIVGGVIYIQLRFEQDGKQIILNMKPHEFGLAATGQRAGCKLIKMETGKEE